MGWEMLPQALVRVQGWGWPVPPSVGTELGKPWGTGSASPAQVPGRWEPALMVPGGSAAEEERKRGDLGSLAVCDEMGANTSPPVCIQEQAQLTDPTGEPRTGIPQGSTIPMQLKPEAFSVKAICPLNTKQEAVQEFTRNGHFAIDGTATGQPWAQHLIVLG